MTNTINSNNSEPIYSLEKNLPEAKSVYYADIDILPVFGYEASSAQLSGKAHLTNNQTIGITFLISSIFFGILALMFPQASVAYAIYSGLSMSNAIAAGILLAPDVFNGMVRIPVAADAAYSTF